MITLNNLLTKTLSFNQTAAGTAGTGGQSGPGQGTAGTGGTGLSGTAGVTGTYTTGSTGTTMTEQQAWEVIKQYVGAGAGDLAGINTQGSRAGILFPLRSPCKADKARSAALRWFPPIVQEQGFLTLTPLRLLPHSSQRPILWLVCLPYRLRIRRLLSLDTRKPAGLSRSKEKALTGRASVITPIFKQVTKSGPWREVAAPFLAKMALK